MDALVDSGWGFALVLFRTAALLMSAPLSGAPFVNARVRLSISFVLALALYAACGAPHPPLPSNLLQLALAGGTETLLGLCGGLGAKLALDAAQGAGQIAATAMGLSYGAQLDPASGTESTAIGTLLSLVALGLALAAGLQHELIRWLFQSLLARPPGAHVELAGFAAQAMTQAIFGATLALRLGLPLLGAMTLGYTALGLAGRAAPQLNLNNLGFSVSILAGGFALWMLAPAACELAARASIAALH